MGRDRAEPDAGRVDDPQDPDIRQPEHVGDGRARLAALPDWHPSSPRYQPDRAAGPDPSVTSPRAAKDKAGAGPSGWEDLGEQGRDRPSPGDIRVSAERRAHILVGDQTGGGHRHGVGSPGKTEFPADWDDGTVIENVLSVAREPDDRPVRQNWNDRWRVQGERDGVKIVAIVTSNGLVWAAWPREGSPGVVKNKPEDR